MKFRKLLLLTLIFVLFFAASCQKDDNNPDDGDKPVDGGDDGDDEEEVFNFMGRDFVIMVDTVASVDPRDGNYKKLFKAEKAANITKVQSKYNLKVKFEAYPGEASWGGKREQYIINQSTSGKNYVHVFEMTSYSVGTLAANNAISPLTSYIEKYGNKGYWPSSKLFGTALGEVYAYQDAYPMAEEGLFYNIDMLEEYLGEGKGNLPSQMWLNGEWTWDTFEALCKQLDEKLPEDYYVLGGKGYNWAYQMLGANGVHVVNTDLRCELETQAGIDTITYMNNLWHTVRWDTKSPALDNATSKYMVEGKVAFHNGQNYWIFQQNKWLNKKFAVGFVPYPVGPNVKDTENLSDYYINDVYGKTQYVISSSFSKDNVKPGYESSTLYDEIIFKIWNDLQYFPEIDEETGYVNPEGYVDEYTINRMDKYYGNEESTECHLSIIDRAYPDYFYSLDEAKAQDDSGFMLQIEYAITGEKDNIRSSMQNITKLVHQAFINKYKLAEDYYD